jgi:hypothetical protein
MTTIHIGGRLVQIGKTLEDLNLLKYNKELRSLAYYHSWKLNGEELKDENDDITNLSDNNKCYSIPYFDGTRNNFLFIKGGLVTTLNLVSDKIMHGNSNVSMDTEIDILNKTYGKDVYKIVNLPYLKGIIVER